MISATPEQQDAIDYEGGNLLILACAGSGKTETLARRISRMVQSGVDRGSIVAFTFTEHAAAELKQRIRTKLEEDIPEEPSLGDMYVGTIHSFCLRILRERDSLYRKYEVMDEARQAALIATNFVRFEDSGRGIGLQRLRTKTKSNTYGETLRTFLNTLNVIHQQQIDLEALDQPVLFEAVSAYREIAYGYPNFFFDFNKIIDELLSFLETNPKELESIRRDLSHVFVDEYQDVDDRQERLIQLLTHNGSGPLVTVVGDDDQALYGFRGARVRNILTFEDRYPDVKTVTLDANFRSTHAIVSIADEAVKLVSERISKEPVARLRHSDGSLVERLAERGDIQLQTFPDEHKEARWVASRIKALRGVSFEQKNNTHRGLDYGDMAILLRSVRGAGSIFAEVLRDEGIPVVISGTGGLFNNDEIRLIQASFSLLSRSEFAVPDESGRIQLLTTIETREFVRTVIERLRSQDRFGKHANHTRYLSWIDQKRAEFDERALKKEDRRGRLGARIYPQEIFQTMLAVLGSKADGWPSEVMFNLGAFSDLLSQFEAVHQWITPARLKSLTLFLSNWAAKHVDEGGLSEVAALNSVSIMTVHAAKGLEWPVVFLPRISSSNFPSSMRTRGPELFLGDGSYDKSVYVGGDDGERRLWYVALTRCAKFLNVSSLDRTRKRPTNYFKDIVHDCVSRNGIDPTEREKIEPTPPIGSELLPTTYSDLSTFWRCKYEYQLRSLMDFSPGVGEQFGYGQQVHNILAEIHQRAIAGNPVTPVEIDQLVEDRFHLRYTRRGPLDAMKRAASIGLKKYVEKFGDTVLKARAVEKPFEFVDQASGAMISGVVDLLEAGDPLLPSSRREIVGLVDFKSKKITDQKDYEKLEQSVTDQLQLYALGVQYALSKEPGSAAAHIVSHSEIPEALREEGKSERIPVDVSVSARQQLLHRVSETVSAIRDGITKQDFEKTGVETGGCLKCDFRVFCDGFDRFSKSQEKAVSLCTPQQDEDSDLEDLMEEMGARQEAE